MRLESDFMIAGVFDRLFKKKPKTGEDDQAYLEYPDESYERTQMAGGGIDPGEFHKEPSELDMDSKVFYSYNGPEYHLKLHNSSIEMLGDITIFLRSQKKSIAKIIGPKKVIEMLKPSKSLNLKFKIKPKYVTGRTGIYGKIEYFDFNSKERKVYRLPQAFFEIKIDKFKSKKITEDNWRQICSGMESFNIETEKMDNPPDQVFKIFRNVLNKLEIFLLEPIENVNLYRGIQRGYCYDGSENSYTIEVQIIGDKESSKTLFRVWSNNPQQAMAMSFKIINIIEEIMEIKRFIVET